MKRSLGLVSHLEQNSLYEFTTRFWLYKGNGVLLGFF
jgi:hypothetical protein